MQATGAGNHQRKVILFWGWFAIDPPIKSGTAELGNDFVSPAAGRTNQPSALQMQPGRPTCNPPNRSRYRSLNAAGWNPILLRENKNKEPAPHFACTLGETENAND
jgi:hypothetical protein